MKQLQITPKIEAAIKRSTDGSVDPNTVAVFEVSSFNTLPVNKRGLFNQARASETTLRQMADYLNAGTDYAPLHVEHNQGYDLPVGRTFAGEVVRDANGVAELRTMIYIPRGSDKGPDLIAKLDSGVIDEVSVGLQASHLNCSECGFDYRGPDATFMHLYEGVCANGHEVGQDGVHVIMNGMDKFLELSLVSRGAAQKTKIVSRTKSIMGEDAFNKLAASGTNPEIITLFATPTTPQKEAPMDVNKLVEDLTTVKASVLVKDQEITSKTATITELQASVATLTAENATLKTNADATKVTALTAEVETLKASSGEVVAFVREEAERLSVAAGLPKPAEGIGFADLKASIETARTKLRESLPQGGVAQTGDPALQASAKQTESYNTAFKTR